MKIWRIANTTNTDYLFRLAGKIDALLSEYDNIYQLLVENKIDEVKKSINVLKDKETLLLVIEDDEDGDMFEKVNDYYFSELRDMIKSESDLFNFLHLGTDIVIDDLVGSLCEDTQHMGRYAADVEHIVEIIKKFTDNSYLLQGQSAAYNQCKVMGHILEPWEVTNSGVRENSISKCKYCHMEVAVKTPSRKFNVGFGLASPEISGDAATKYCPHHKHYEIDPLDINKEIGL